MFRPHVGTVTTFCRFNDIMVSVSNHNFVQCTAVLVHVFLFLLVDFPPIEVNLHNRVNTACNLVPGQGDMSSVW